MTKQTYLNFDEYIRQGEPGKKERAEAWSVAIGLQAVDGLKTSEYLQQTARRNIEGEANTRTTAVFTIQYLRSLGFDVNNDPFARHSWYFRNALVRANYRNVAKGIDYTPVYLERFFRNLLLGEQWDLRNRYLHIHPTEEWSVQPNLAPRTSTGQVPEQVPEQVRGLLHSNNSLVVGLVKVIGEEELSLSQLMEKTGLKHRPNFIEYHLNPAIKEGYVRLLYPKSPRHPRQRYLLTGKGLALYNELNKNSSLTTL